jgi:TPR repeat protein
MDKTRYDRERLLIEAERFEEADNYKLAAKVLLRGAKSGDTTCQLNLGNYYASGTGVRKNLVKAAYWYETAYKNGNRAGALNLAIDERNRGDFRAAERWFKKAVAMHDGSAYIELARMYVAQGKKRLAALELLRQVIKLNRDNVSIDEKAEAKSLLRALKSETAQKRKKSVNGSRGAQSSARIRRKSSG